MKWLFAILVALNIIVFGGMLFSRMGAPQQQQAAAPPAAPAQPTVVQIHTGAQPAAPATQAPAQPAAPTSA